MLDIRVPEIMKSDLFQLVIRKDDSEVLRDEVRPYKLAKLVHINVVQILSAIRTAAYPPIGFLFLFHAEQQFLKGFYQWQRAVTGFCFRPLLVNHGNFAVQHYFRDGMLNRKGFERQLQQTAKKDGFDTVIVTNGEREDAALAAMIADFAAVYPYKTRVINIAEYPFAGGCLGCFRCAADGKCVYRDGFDRFLREEIQTAGAIVYAFTIKDHSMGASFKRYDDRQFCNGHRTVTMGMPMGYLISGDYASEENLRLIIEGRCQVGQNFLAGCATDAEGIAKLSARLAYALETGYAPPQNFLGVGGMKIFRDLIYQMRGLMKADHKFYKQHGIYDFPQKKVGTILKIKLVGALATNPKIQAKLGNKMNVGMIAPYQKVIEKARMK